MERLKPKEKALDLIDKHKDYCFHNFDNDADEQRKENARLCSIITAEEIIEWCKPNDEDCGFSLQPSLDYWTEVKLELENRQI